MINPLRPENLKYRYFFVTFNGEKRRFRVQKYIYFCALKCIKKQAKEESSNMPSIYIKTLAMYLCDMDIRRVLARSTFYKHRAEIYLSTSIDISNRDPETFVNWLESLITTRNMTKKHRNFSEFIDQLILEKIVDPKYLPLETN